MIPSEPAGGVPPRLERALARLSPLHRDLLFALMRAEGAAADERIADRYGAPPARMRLERSLARQRLSRFLAEPPAPDR